MRCVVKNFALFIISRISVDFIHRPKEENKLRNIRLISISKNKRIPICYKNKLRYKMPENLIQVLSENKYWLK